MLIPRDTALIMVVFAMLASFASAAIFRSGRIARPDVCSEQYKPGVYVLQHIEPRPDDDERTRKIIDQHNRILTLECGR